MPMPTVFETQETFHAAIPEGFREHYKEKEGKFYLEVDKPEVVATGLAANRDAVLKEKKAMADKVAAYESRFKGKTVEEIEALIEAADKAALDEAKKSAEPDKIDKIIERHGKVVEDLKASHKAEIERLTATINKFKVDDQLEKAALKGGIFEDYVGDVVELIRPRAQLAENDDLLILDKPNGEPLSVSLERFFSDVFKQEKPLYYKATEAGGGGATKGGNKFVKKPDYSNLPAEERMKLARQPKTA